MSSPFSRLLITLLLLLLLICSIIDAERPAMSTRLRKCRQHVIKTINEVCNDPCPADKLIDAAYMVCTGNLDDDDILGLCQCST